MFVICTPILLLAAHTRCSLFRLFFCSLHSRLPHRCLSLLSLLALVGSLFLPSICYHLFPQFSLSALYLLSPLSLCSVLSLSVLYQFSVLSFCPLSALATLSALTSLFLPSLCGFLTFSLSLLSDLYLLSAVFFLFSWVFFLANCCR